MNEDIIDVIEENVEDIVPVEEETVIVNTGGTNDHAKLKHLDYENSGHTGFQPAGNYVVDEHYIHTDNNFSDEEKEKLSSLENYDDTQVKQDINTINEKIPTQATNNNKLADKDFVNSSLNSITAFYITKNADGDQFNNKAELDSATEFYSGGEVRVPTRNDYCIVLADETKDNSTTRYIYQNNQWEFQYVVNETPLTSEQLKAINSGITLELVAKLQGIDLTDYVKNTDYADNSKFGVVKTNSNYGIQTENGVLYINRASEAQIKARHQWAPITPNNLDLALKIAMCDGVGAEWTADEQKSARTRMGINEHITLTQAEYDALVSAGTVDENTYYYIKEE